jgi:hypothetical protein
VVAWEIRDDGLDSGGAANASHNPDSIIHMHGIEYVWEGCMSAHPSIHPSVISVPICRRGLHCLASVTALHIYVPSRPPHIILFNQFDIVKLCDFSCTSVKFEIFYFSKKNKKHLYSLERFGAPIRTYCCALLTVSCTNCVYVYVRAPNRQTCGSARTPGVRTDRRRVAFSFFFSRINFFELF